MPSVTERLRLLVDSLPDDAAVTLSAATLRGWLESEPIAPPPPPVSLVESQGWRERIWTCPPDTRMGVRDLAEALDRSADWVYRATNAKRAEGRGRDPLPCSRLDGVLVFTAGAVRSWLQSSEFVVNPAPPAAGVREIIRGRHLMRGA